jgi:ubiquitin-protein ligase
MSSAAQLRRQADLDLLQRLVDRANGLLQFRTPWHPSQDHIHLRAHLPTSADQTFPIAKTASFDFDVFLPVRYPFAPPTVSMATSLWHPNVFTNGTICLGTQWQVSEGLDLFITRVVRLLTYDPLLINLSSPANHAAARWYDKLAQENTRAFPTIDRDAQGWLFDPRAEKIVVPCPACSTKLRLPAGKQGLIACPKCQHEFSAST